MGRLSVIFIAWRVWVSNDENLQGVVFQHLRYGVTYSCWKIFWEGEIKRGRESRGGRERDRVVGC